MNKLIKTQYFTPKEFESLSPKFIENMLHNEVPFVVSTNIQLEEGFSWVVATSKLLKENNGSITTIDLTKIELFATFLSSDASLCCHDISTSTSALD